MNNREEIDGFLAALICSPDIAEYLPEIWGGEMTYDEAFVDREQLMDFLGLLTRHWDSIVGKLHGEDVFAPLLHAPRAVRPCDSFASRQGYG
jgi:uncharacterized protein